MYDFFHEKCHLAHKWVPVVFSLGENIGISLTLKGLKN